MPSNLPGGNDENKEKLITAAGHWVTDCRLPNYEAKVQITQHPYRSPAEDTIAILKATPSGSNVMGGKHSYILPVTEHTIESGS